SARPERLPAGGAAVSAAAQGHPGAGGDRERGLRLPWGTLAYGLGLAAVWVLLWGAFSWANALSGALVAAALIAWLVPRQRRGRHVLRLRPAALVRLGLFLARQLVVSNYMVAREVLAARSRLRT